MYNSPVRARLGYGPSGKLPQSKSKAQRLAGSGGRAHPSEQRGFPTPADFAAGRALCPGVVFNVSSSTGPRRSVTCVSNYGGAPATASHGHPRCGRTVVDVSRAQSPTAVHPLLVDWKLPATAPRRQFTLLPWTFLSARATTFSVNAPVDRSTGVNSRAEIEPYPLPLL